MRRTKIVATIGPACDHPDVLRSLMLAGMDVARLNLSHGDVKTHRERIHLIRKTSEQLGRSTAIMLDTQGPEVRLGLLSAPLKIAAGTELFFSKSADDGDGSVAVSWPGLFDLIQPGQKLWIDDGNIVVECAQQEGKGMRTKVLVGGLLQSRKKISSPDVTWPLDILSGLDQAALLMGMEEDVDMVAGSFIRSAEDVLAIRKFYEDRHHDAFIVSKIENHAGVDNLGDILAVSDGVMVARGDLGVELPPERVPWLQKDIISQANRMGIPVVTATQMLESMTHAPRPTRAEVSDVAHAIWDGSDSVMLSAETASGAYPVESVEMMAKIARDADIRPQTAGGAKTVFSRVSDAVSHAAAEIADSLGARAILTITQTGYTARMVSRSRPTVPIVAVSDSVQVVRRLQMSWGVWGIHSDNLENSESMTAQAIDKAVQCGFLEDGNLVVLVAGIPRGAPGTTNFVRVETVSHPLMTGLGLGYGEPVTARVEFYAPRAERPQGMYVAVTRDYVPEQKDFLAGACAIIAEREGRTTDIAVAAATLGIPAVVGISGAMHRFHEGQIVTLDPVSGAIYRGTAQT